MTAEELLRAGAEAARQGKREEATRLLTQAIQANPRSEHTWLWLGFCRHKADERSYCFQRVLAINHNNQEARRQLALLSQPKAGAPQAPVTPAKKMEQPLPAKNEIIDSSQPRPGASPPRNPGRVPTAPGRKRKTGPWMWLALFGFAAFCGIILAAVWMFNDQITGISQPPGANQPAPPLETATSMSPASAPKYAAVFEPGPCAFDIPEGTRVDCGFVIVPENRSGDLSDTIKIAVAVYRSANPTPAPEPIIFITGGPGSQAIQWSRDVYSTVVAPLIAERDFIVFDPRGVGLSQPSLDCDELRQTYVKDLRGKLPAGQEVAYYEGALLNCYHDMTAQGIDLSAYNSVTTAADVRDIILSLGYRQANLYGVSYGSRIAQIAMRDHPEVVRSVILDSVVPVDANLLEGTSALDEDLLALLFADCASDPQCSTAYPNLEQAYSEIVQRLDQQPVTLNIVLTSGETDTQTLTGAKFSGALHGATKYSGTLSIIPQAIYRAQSGDYSAIESALSVSSNTASNLTLGVFVSFYCREHILASTPEKLGDVLFKLCGHWRIEPPAPGENDPVHSDIPALILAGKYDPTTPPKLAERVKQGLSNGYLFEFGGEAHAPSTTDTSGCSQTLINIFLQNPEIEPRHGCLEATNRVDFVLPHTAASSIDWSTATDPINGIQFQIPSGWRNVGNGYFVRYNSRIDLTTLGIQRANVGELTWINWLMTEFKPSGFDARPAQNGMQKANGLSWTLYQTTSHGHPVDLAFAKIRGDTLMILLLTHVDEHDAFFQTVFLPVINSVEISR